MKASYYYNPIVKKENDTYYVDVYRHFLGKDKCIGTLTDKSYKEVLRRVNDLMEHYELTGATNISLLDLLTGKMPNYAG